VLVLSPSSAVTGPDFIRLCNKGKNMNLDITKRPKQLNSTLVTKATIEADWILKRWIKFQIAVKTFEFHKLFLWFKFL
jgi:hypothetical protein